MRTRFLSWTPQIPAVTRVFADGSSLAGNAVAATVPERATPVIGDELAKKCKQPVTIGGDENGIKPLR